MPRGRSIDGIWFGLAASLALHLVLVPMIWRAAPDRPALAPAPSHREMDLVRLGLERSDHATITWLGFADPTPHKAVPSETEQAALSRALMGEPGPGSTAEQAEMRPDPTPPMPPAQQTPESPSAGEHARLATPRALSGEEVPAATPDDPWRIRPRPDGFLPPPPEAPRSTRPPAPRSETPDAPPRSTPRETPPPPDPASRSAATPSPPGGDDLPGLPSDRESAPTAERPALTLRDWGKPAAGEGIEILPRRPRWGPTVYSLAWPKNPTVIIEFGRDGRVRRARFAEAGGKVLNTGAPEVDRVLLNTIYNWTARGKKIEALAAEGPGSRLAIVMDIRLRW